MPKKFVTRAGDPVAEGVQGAPLGGQQLVQRVVRVILVLSPLVTMLELQATIDYPLVARGIRQKNPCPKS
jgi:hypothetical protein